ncbi:FtsX-like permease family protein [Amycolatopsis xylanica]|uniref:FtsX-like permease family protein n=1 Tax=Amycolatopsis xylanica TaxID=589385 RepID=A0A1H3DEX1_9PSEU|nr:FtsX-like permease family protein [Amycolatopsis xylanica]SDX64921.1 FtsX-like permease family protein [Amycolatopsis xylanica]
MRTDLAIGVRLAVGRHALARFVLVAGDVGLCVAVLLFAAGELGPHPGRLVAVVAVAGFLLAPLLVFVASVARLGGPERDRRLATLRLLGASARQVRRVAIAESLTGAVAGLVLGMGVFFAVRGFGAVAWPALVVVAAVAPVLAAGAALAGTRDTAVEPLGVVRRGETAVRRVRWRVVPIVLGVVLLVIGVASTGETADLTAAAGLVSVLVSIPVLLPWLVERAVGGLRGGRPSWQLAVRRLQADSGTPSRVAGGVAVLLAAAVGARTVLRSAPPVPLVGEGVSLMSVFTLLVAGASLLVLVVQQLSERRRAVAALAASGVPWGVIGRSLLWQNLIPIGFGVVVADLAGAGLAAAVVRMADARVSFDWPFTIVVSALAVVMVMVVTVSAIPLVRASAHSDALREE